jgi:hypothetical protein
MSTRIYLCAYVAAIVLASTTSALDAKDEFAPLEDSRKPDKAKIHGERDLMADWWNNDWRETYQPTKRPPTRRPSKKPVWWGGWEGDGQN